MSTHKVFTFMFSRRAPQGKSNQQSIASGDQGEGSGTIIRNHNRHYAALLLMLIGMTGCSAGSPRRVAEMKITEKLPELIGPATIYTTHVNGSIFDLGRGYAKSIVIDGSGVHVAPAITLQTMEIVVNDVHFERNKTALKSTGTIEFSSAMTEQQFNDYLGYRYPGRQLSTVFLNDGLVVSIPVVMWNMGTAGSLQGQLEAENGTEKIDFEARSAHVGGIPVPMSIVEKGLRDLNPIITIYGLPFQLKLRSAVVKDNFLQLSGNVVLPQGFLSNKNIKG